MKPTALIFGCLLLATALLAGGCDTTGTSVVGGKCTSDSNCNEGYYCADTGVCLPKVDSDGDETDAEWDADLDWEQWEKECPAQPTMPTVLPDDCKTWTCDPVNPPECWNCYQVADPDQNGEICEYNGSPGICSNGDCTVFADGDEDTDTGNGCTAMGGVCAAAAQNCVRGSRPAASALGCDTVCCLPLMDIDCYQQDGYCAPAPESGIVCRDGYAPAANTDNECVLFGEGCCLPTQQDCVAEGVVGSAFDNLPCCSGLTQVPNAWPDSDNQCMSPNDASFRCTRCGDDECGPGENFCSCPDDCAKPGECTMDTDCPSASCMDAGIDAIACVQVTTACDVSTGNCVSASETVFDTECNMTTGLCEAVVPPCVPLGQMGYMPNGVCCEGLTQESYATINTTGACEFPECSCFVCLVIGDDYCDIDNYENACNSDDCNNPPACVTDADCAANTCQGLSGLPNCIQYTESCIEGSCLQGQTQLENSLCNEETGMCEPRNPTACELQNGYCTVWEDTCGDGYATAGDPMGCPGGWSAKCCIPGTPNPCTDGGGICIPNAPGSMCPGDYHAQGDIGCGADGVYCCMPDIECETSEGYCSSLQAGCAADYYNANDTMGCGDGGDRICCLPTTPTRCAQQDGQCVNWQSQCPPDTYASSDNLDCNRSEQCCLPVGPCIAEGGEGNRFQGDQCCEGLASIGNLFMDETGQCTGASDGSFICAKCGNGICGPGENECNCARDCAANVECASASDCIGNDWLVDCYGYWECSADGQCTEACGPPCGNNRCEPDRGESMESCPQDCDITGECRSDWDCGQPQCSDTSAGCVQETPTCENGACVTVTTTAQGGQCDARTGQCVGGTPSCLNLDGYCTGFNDGCGDGYVENGEASCGDQVCAGGCICCVPDVPTTCENGTCAYFWESCPAGTANTGERLDCPILSTCCL